jgi:hypothetical protein
MPWWWGAGPGTDTPTGSDARRRHLRERAIGCARGGGLHNSRRRIGVRQSHQFLVGRAALVLSWGRRQGPAGRPRTGRPMKRASGQPRYKARAGRHAPVEVWRPGHHERPHGPCRPRRRSWMRLSRPPQVRSRRFEDPAWQRLLDANQRPLPLSELPRKQRIRQLPSAGAPSRHPSCSRRLRAGSPHSRAAAMRR